MEEEIVILANGYFPEHPVPLSYLTGDRKIVCCDGASMSLENFGIEPYAIVGDCDSLSGTITDKYSDRIVRIEEQETNDLTKSVNWCISKGYRRIAIVGATGKREDHSIGNISLLVEYARLADVKMLTDTGAFYPLLESSSFKSFPAQRISVFSIDPLTVISSSGLKYPLVSRRLRNWWEATLNEATGHSFRLDFLGGPLIVFMEYREGERG